MRTPKVKSKCAICHEEGDGYHFGAEACKACAAFFRRSVQQKKTYRCRGNDDCDVTVNIRCMCRSCRFSKCLQMGMNPMGVQIKTPSPDTPSSTPSSSSSIPPTRSALLLLELPPSYSTPMPLLMKMRENYKKLTNARLVVHREDGKSLFEERIPKAVNYRECVDQGMKDVVLTADWISWCFEDFVALPIDQKNALFRHFYTPYYMLEGAFSSHLHDNPRRVIFPSGDFMDLDRLELFYRNDDLNQPLTKEQIDNLFKPSFMMHRKSLILPVMAENLDIFEFFALTTFLLWDTTLDEISEECAKLGKRVKDQVITELSYYMRNFKNIEDPSTRIAAIVNLLPAVYKSTRRVQDDLEITQVFNIYKASKEFYDMINGRFC